MAMFCRQCEQTNQGKGCTIRGVCGKNQEVATLQDLLIAIIKAIAVYGQKLNDLGIRNKSGDNCLIESLFTTITNVNFDKEDIKIKLIKAYKVKEDLKREFLAAYKKKYAKEFNENLPEVCSIVLADSLEGLLKQGEQFSVLANPKLDDDLRSLREILLYGLKGMAAYADHARILGQISEEVNSFFSKGLDSLVNDNLKAQDLLALIMEFGQVNLKCLELLDKAHTTNFGKPTPTKVFLGIKKGPAIIISGHDLLDLKQLLEQTKDKGINIYTHGEMLPAHGYPELKKYKHLVGHFGTAWQNQQKEFDNIPAVVLMTTNCIQEPRKSYQANIFTTGLVAWPEVEHITAKDGKKDFSKLIKRAQDLGGFKEDAFGKEILVGFGHDTVLSLADKILAAVKAKQIRHIFLIGGCDGAKSGRNYYTDFAQKVPQDCLILTLACGKFRFNQLDLGTIGSFPRLLDCGQCNDAYSAIYIAIQLAKALGVGVNDLPLSLVLSWYEQKAVCILLTLLSLGIKNIHLGPSLPAFISPNVLKILVEKFNIKPISTVDKDLANII